MNEISDTQFPVGPAHLFDMDEILDESTLQTEVTRDEIVESQARPGKEVRVIHLTFTSSNWHGYIWTHTTHIYVPVGYKGDGNVGIIGAAWEFFEEGSEREFIPETGLPTESEYAEGTAIDLNIPIMIFTVPAEEINGMHESDLMGHAGLKLFETGDLTWYGYYPIIKAYLRAITLLHAIPEIKAEKAVLYGCSKRGHSVSVATGVDPERVAGVMATCYPGGNHLYNIVLKYAQFGPDIGGPAEDRTGPGYQPASVLLRGMNTPIGLKMLSVYDPYIWRDRIRASYLVAIGTNDEFFGLGAPNEMINQFDGDKAFLAIDNLPHTWVSEKHLIAWRMWLTHTFHGRKIPGVEVDGKRTGSNLKIEARVDSETSLQSVKLFYSYNPKTDWRFATWFSVPMKEEGDCFSAELDIKERQNLAYYVEVEDRVEGCKGLVSSLVEVINNVG